MFFMALKVKGVSYNEQDDSTDFAKLIHDPKHKRTTLFIINENFAAWKCPTLFENGSGTACIRSFTYCPEIPQRGRKLWGGSLAATPAPSLHRARDHAHALPCEMHRLAARPARVRSVHGAQISQPHGIAHMNVRQLHCFLLLCSSWHLARASWPL
jgi:hypothetical protein